MKTTAASLKAQTKVYLSVLVACGSFLQIPAVNAFALNLTRNHPHAVSVIGTLTAIAALLHNPEVQDALGLRRTVTAVTEEVVAITPQPAAEEKL